MAEQQSPNFNPTEPGYYPNSGNTNSGNTNSGNDTPPTQTPTPMLLAAEAVTLRNKHSP